MSYNINLQNKNLKLQEILNKINNLPEAGGGTDTSDATATPDLVYQGETFYSANGKETGTMSLDTEIASQNELLTQIENALLTKANGGYETGVADGKQQANDAFWNTYQENGNRVNYDFAFGGLGWTDDTFKPKYDMKPTAATRMFGYTGIADLKGILEEADVVLDLSQVTSMTYFIEGAVSKITRLPELNLTSMANLNYFIYHAYALKSIDKIILKSDGSQTFANTSFGYLIGLEEIRFEGVIGKTINFQWSPLSRASIENILSCLSRTASGQTLSLKKTAVNKAFETSAGANDGSTSSEWNLLVNGDGTEAHPGITNWTITLV